MISVTDRLKRDLFRMINQSLKMGLLSSVRPTNSELCWCIGEKSLESVQTPRNHMHLGAEETVPQGSPFLMLRKRCPFPFYQTFPTWFTLYNSPLSNVLFTLVTLTKKSMEDLFWVAIKYQLPEYPTKIWTWGNAATSYTNLYNIFHFNLLLFLLFLSCFKAQSSILEYFGGRIIYP